MRQTVYKKCEHPAKHSRNILSLRKLFYSGLFIKISHSRNPTFNKCPNKHWILEQCAAHAECGKNYEILLLATLTRILTWKSNAWLGVPHFGLIIHCVKHNSSQMTREGGWAVLELPDRLCKRKAVMLSQERIVNKILYRPFLWSKWIFFNSVYVTWLNPTFHDLNIFFSILKKLFSYEKVSILFIQFC